MANVMENPRIEKVVINIGVGESGERLGKAEQLLAKFTEKKPVRTVSRVKNPSWNVRKGEAIGCKVTLRGPEANEIIKRSLYAKNNILRNNNFDKSGNVSFGIQEYIDVQGLKYDPIIGIYGFNVNINLMKPGYRIAKRSRNKTKIPTKARVSKEQAIEYMKDNFGVKIEEEE